jgi:putative restriction endonuclease
MKIWIGVTDRSWFEQQKAQAPEEVNFWQPGGTSTFKVLPEEGLFLFKLHHPDNFIAGGGYFVRHSFLPVSLAWKAFGLNNGVRDLAEFQARIRKYRRDDAGHDPVIGCIVLAQPFFLEQHAWIPVPESFKKNIVTGKSYEADSAEGGQLIELLRLRLTGPSRVGTRFRLGRSEWIRRPRSIWQPTDGSPTAWPRFFPCPRNRNLPASMRPHR